MKFRRQHNTALVPSLPAQPQIASSSKPQRETRNMADLHPWPDYSAYFAAIDEAYISELAADIRRHGLATPIEIACDGRILDGHARLAALKLLKRTKVVVRVRYDLEDDEGALEERFLLANFARRKVTPMAAARVYRRVKALRSERRSANGEGELREQLAKHCEITGRHLDDYEKCLDLPGGVLACLEQGTLGITQAKKVLCMPAKLQRKVDTAIEQGAKPRDVVRQYMPSTGPSATQTIGGLTKYLQLAQDLDPGDLVEQLGEQYDVFLATLDACYRRFIAAE